MNWLKKLALVGGITLTLGLGNACDTSDNLVDSTLEQRLAFITNSEGKLIFIDPRLFSLTNSEGASVFHNVYNLVLFKKVGGTFKKAKRLLSLKYPSGKMKGKQIITDWFDIYAFKKHKCTDNYTLNMAGILDGQGMPVYPGKKPTFLKKGKVSFKFARDIGAIWKKDGSPMFNTQDVCYFSEYKVPLDYIQDFLNERYKNGNCVYDACRISKFYKLGLSKTEVVMFSDTEKPNALVVHPYSDYNKAFRNAASRRFLRKIQKKYDTKIIVASHEEEVYEAIQSVSHLELLILSGHGTKNRLTLSNKVSVSKTNRKDYLNTFDLYDSELEHYLNMLDPNAVIFLNSCSNAKGGESAKNLANFVAEQAGNRKVIAAKEPFGSLDVIITNLYPLDLQIKDFNSGNNITYKSEPARTKPHVPKKIMPKSNYQSPNIKPKMMPYHKKAPGRRGRK